MKKYIFLILTILTVSVSASPLPFIKSAKEFKAVTALPASNMVYTTLQESESFHKEFVTFINRVCRAKYEQYWNQGLQNPNSQDGRAYQFAKLILQGDEKTIHRIKSYLLNTDFSYTFTDDVQLRVELRDNFDSHFIELTGAY